MKIQNAQVLNILDRSQIYFAHVTTVTLSWRVQNIVVIGHLYFTLKCFEFHRISNSIEICLVGLAPGPNIRTLVVPMLTQNPFPSKLDFQRISLSCSSSSDLEMMSRYKGSCWSMSSPGSNIRTLVLPMLTQNPFPSKLYFQRISLSCSSSSDLEMMSRYKGSCWTSEACQVLAQISGPWFCPCWSKVLSFHKNIKRHTAHTIVSWPNPKQWIIVHNSNLMMIIRQSNIFSQPSRWNWVNWKYTAPYIE